MNEPSADFDPRRRYVRIVELRADGLVEFEFAVGEPQLYVEMVLPRAAFDDFCATQNVVPTTTALAMAPAGSAEHEWDWSLHAARSHPFRHEPAD